MCVCVCVFCSSESEIVHFTKQVYKVLNVYRNHKPYIRLITIRDGEKVEGGMEVGEEEDYIATLSPLSCNLDAMPALSHQLLTAKDKNPMSTSDYRTWPKFSNDQW